MWLEGDQPSLEGAQNLSEIHLIEQRSLHIRRQREIQSAPWIALCQRYAIDTILAKRIFQIVQFGRAEEALYFHRNATALFLSGLSPTALAATAFAVTTPYPSIAVAPGSTASFDLTITSPTDGTVQLAVSPPPTGWTATLHGGGFVVSSVTIASGKAATARLDVKVPGDSTVTDGKLTVTAKLGSRTTTLDLDVKSSADVAGDITLTTDSPTLTGPSDSPFTFCHSRNCI